MATTDPPSSYLLHVATYSGAVQTLKLTIPNPHTSTSTSSDPSASLTVSSETRDCGANPSWLTLDPGRGLVYCVDEQLDGGSGGLHVLRRGEGDGRLTRIGGIKTLLGPAHGVLHGRENGLYTLSHYGDAAISTIDVSAPEAPKERAECHIPHTLHSGQHADRQKASHPHQAVVDPSGRYMFVPDLGTDSIHVYTLDGAPEQTSFSHVVDVPLPPGSGPRHLVFARTTDDDGGDKGAPVYMYVVTELENRIHGWKVDLARLKDADGSQAFVGVHDSSTHGPAEPAGSVANAAELLVSPDHKFVLVSSRFDPFPASSTSPDTPEDTIAVFAIDRASGRLDHVQTMGARGRNPRHMSLNAAGTLLAVALQHESCVVVFERDVGTGKVGREVARVYTAKLPVAVIWDE